MAVMKKILIIDDDRELAEGLRVVLEGCGYQVVTANDGAAGLHAAACDMPDLVIVDMMMPKKSGFLVLEGLKANPKCPKVIMMTANEGNRHRDYAQMLGVDDYLRKPFALDRLLECVQEQFGQTHAQDAQ